MNLRLSLLIAAFALLALESTAAAFCGFYVSGGDASLFNDATQVVLMRHGEETVLSMQNSYEGPLEDFAMVVPVPEVLKESDVKTLKKEVFDKVDRLSAPRLVEYWERDPCYEGMIGLQGGFGSGSFGFGGLGTRGTGRGGGGGFVNVVSSFEVGEYDVVVLDTNDAAALDTWLKTNKYSIPAGAEPYFRPYIESGMYFFVARVNAKKVTYEDGRAVLSPLRFHYASKEFSLPIRLGMINSKGKQDLLVYVLAQDQRYEVANYPNATVPTNVEVSPDVRHDFGTFYEAMFSRTVEENPKAVVTEYAWQATKCDPCPAGAVGGAALQQNDLLRLGGDVLGLTSWSDQQKWVLTRLHARYAPDDVGADLVFKKADPIMGGREVRKPDGTLEKGAVPADSVNQFQGRYIVRHEWEGKVECDDPTRGIWGPPPSPEMMKAVHDTAVLENRRQKALAEGASTSGLNSEGPYTAEERESARFHLVSKYGTSFAPASSNMVAPSANTLGTTIGRGGGAALATLVREPIPELKVEPISPTPTPANISAKPAKTDLSEPAPDLGTAAAEKSDQPAPTGCDTSGGVVTLWSLIGLGALRRRRRERSDR